MTDDTLFKRYVDGIKGTKKAGNIAKLLADYGIVHYTDIGSTAKFYDTVEKEQRPSRTQVLSSDMRDELERLQRSIGGMN